MFSLSAGTQDNVVEAFNSIFMHLEALRIIENMPVVEW